SEENWLKNYLDDKPEKSRVKILIIDNAEKTYFCRGLLNLSEKEMLNDNPLLYRQMAEKLVDIARSQLQGLVLLMLLNDEKQANSLLDHVQSLHSQLPLKTQFPFPESADKETVIRTNINLLNP